MTTEAPATKAPSENRADSPGTPEVRRGAPGRALRRWLSAFFGLFLISSAWALATPYDGSPDEMQHIIRAAGVAYGDIVPHGEVADSGTGAYQTAPSSLVRDNCWRFKPAKPADCAREPGGKHKVGKQPTRAGRYNPAYYAAVGLPLRLWPDWKGILAARLISAGLVCMLLASAVYSATYWVRHRFMLAGVVVAITPMTLHLAGSVNPNALEIAAGLALFSSLIPLLLDSTTEVRRAALVQAGAAGAVLVTIRALGPLWCLAALAVLLVPTTRQVVGKLWKSRAAWIAAAVIGFAAVLGVAWTVVMKANQLGKVAGSEDMTFWDAVRYIATQRWGDYVAEMVGVMSWLDSRPPSVVYLVWYAAAGAVIVWGALLGTRTDRWRIAAAIAITFLVPTISDAVNVQTSGIVSQGRYLLPLAVGIPLIAAFAIGQSGTLPPGRAVTLTRFVTVLLVPTQMCYLWFAMIRWQNGIGDDHYPNTNPLDGSWHPQVGSLAPLVVCGVGIVWFAVHLWRSARTEEVPAALPR